MMVTLNFTRTKTGIDLFWCAGTRYDSTLSRVYGSKFSSGNWLFPAFSPFYEWVLEDLTTVLEDKLVLSREAKAHVESQKIKEAKVIKGDLFGFTPRFKPYAHQAAGLSRIIYQPRTAIFWDPGMGKTKLMCDRILYERSKNPNAKALILALRVNLSTWVKEMATHSQGREEILPLIASSPAQREKRFNKILEKNPAGIVVTYESARVSVPLLKRFGYSIIIADECHKMQSYRSKLTVAALELAAKATYRYILSGTPTKGKPTDIWASLKFLGDFLVPKYWDFDTLYVMRAHWNRHIVTGYKNLDKLNSLVENIADVRTSEEALDLPDRTFQVIDVEPSPSLKRAYNSIANAEEAVVIEGKQLIVENHLTRLGKLAQASSGFVYRSLENPAICDGCPHMQECVVNSIKPYTSKCKVETRSPGKETIKISKGDVVTKSCMELLSSHIENGKKVIIWAKHREMLDSLYEEACGLLGADAIVRYDSTTSEPGKAEEQFNTNPSKKVIVAQITMGIGVTFKAPIMIYTELSFNLADWLQSLDRNWGIRAKGLGNILVQVLTIPGSIYSQTYGLLQNKVDVASLIKDKPSCSTCSKILDCISKGTQPYEKECILDKAVPVSKIKIGTI